MFIQIKPTTLLQAIWENLLYSEVIIKSVKNPEETYLTMEISLWSEHSSENIWKSNVH